ncbi:MAG: C45 family autoproteolytic acyltransferase/hydrolase [Gemmataceae bacterium]|nr:C45 family autoproteolytic acyltransferase/hydrolase [Gemmataceae bacterium]MDW8265000.1 C45 family autoproteolytic acyltransferase/hydrolase [Gemmataceae bacterium]
MYPKHFSWAVVFGGIIGTLPASAGGDFQPDPASVVRFGPAYRYPQAGWIILHIEGEPYERGYQHGRLLAGEIAAYLRCFAAMQGPTAPAEAWRQTRLLGNALFLRRYDPEYLEEMRGIADGATAGGARFDGRPIDLVDIVCLNSWPEIETLESALHATPTGLEGIRFPRQEPNLPPPPKPMHCSAFAATGPATADGRIVFGHITMFGLYPSRFFNVWIDVKPTRGHRILMQGSPGSIHSGLDYYMNDAGLLVAETTIAQTPFNIQGLSISSRIRKVLQYATSIDQAVELLGTGNNGLYANEWLLADIKTNEIAMFELGTNRTRLYRSSKNEWFGGTPGFYWGCNNAKDQQVRLETVASVQGRPENVVWRPSARDQKWLELYDKYRGKIDADFGKRAFTTPPLVAHHSCDAKVTTSDLAKQWKTWALFGPPLGRTWQPTEEERRKFPEIRPLVSNPWTVVQAQPPPASRPAAVADRPERLAPPDKAKTRPTDPRRPLTLPAWYGTLLPASDGDIWLAAAFAEYERLVAAEIARRDRPHDLEPTADDQLDLGVRLYAYRSQALAAARAGQDVPLLKLQSDLRHDHWYRLAVGKGVLLLHALRQRLGHDAFVDLMDRFGRDFAGKPASTAEFRARAEKLANGRLADFFDTWLTKPGLPGDTTPAGKGVYSILSFYPEQEQTLIVYGTQDEASAQQEAAEVLQRSIRERWSNITIPIKADRDVTDAELKERHLLLIGRPDSNSLVARFRKALPLEFGWRSFRVGEETYAHEGTAVWAAGENPLNPRYSVVVLAGLSAEATYLAAPMLMHRTTPPTEVLVVPHDAPPRARVVSVPDLRPVSWNRD